VASGKLRQNSASVKQYGSIVPMQNRIVWALVSRLRIFEVKKIDNEVMKKYRYSATR
jgi:hypothetical protein